MHIVETYRSYCDVCHHRIYREGTEMHFVNQGEIRKDDNYTSKLNDRSLSNNSCSSEKQRSENGGSKNYEREVHLLESAGRKEYLIHRKYMSK